MLNSIEQRCNVSTPPSLAKRQKEENPEESYEPIPKKQKENKESQDVFSTSISKQTLDPVEFEEWTKAQVCSLLCVKEQKGGYGLNVETVQPLYDATFNGASIYNIVTLIQNTEEITKTITPDSPNYVQFLLQLDNHVYEKTKSKLQNVNGDTIDSVINWVKKLLNTKLYHLWSNSKIIEQLCKPIHEHGANLTENEKQFLQNIDLSLPIDEWFKGNIPPEETLTKIRNWQLACQLHIDLVSFDKPPRVRVDVETPHPEIRTLEDIANLFGLSLEQCFLQRLDQKFTANNVLKFYDREGFKHRVTQMVQNNITHFNNNKKFPAERKNEFWYGIISNGTGNGKTRACKEVQNIILDTIPSSSNEVTYRKLHSYFSFDNGNTLTSVEVDYGPDKEGKVVGLRILCSMMGLNAMALTQKLGNNTFKYLFTRTNLFTLSNIANHFSKYLKQNEMLIWSIAMDEVQKLYNSFGSKWKLPLYTIGEYMVDTVNLNQNLKSNICFIPILSGIKYEGLRFEAPEYGNLLFSLPPLSSSNLKEIVDDFFKGKHFSCNTPLAEMAKVNTGETVQSMGIMLLEALVVPQVLMITLRSICSFLEKLTFKYWYESSTDLFTELQSQVNENVERYLNREDSIMDQPFQQQLIPHLLCGLPLKLNEEEKKLFSKGKLYITSRGTLYVAPHYFLRFINSTDFYISSKLPRTTTKLSPKSVEKIDLKCICYRLDILRTFGNTTNITNIFPCCTTGVQENLPFSIPSTQSMFQVVDHVETFISNDPVTIDLSKCRQDLGYIYSYTSETHPFVDAHFLLTNAHTQKPAMFFIQYKNYDMIQSSYDIEANWLDSDYPEAIITSFGENVEVYFVFITTTSISKNKLDSLKKHKYFPRLILIHHTTPQNDYFPENLLPYQKGYLFLEGRDGQCLASMLETLALPPPVFL